MSLYPMPATGRVSELNYGGVRPSLTFGTAITTGASAHTLSASFAEVFSATSFDTYWVTIIASNNHGANTRTDTLVNIYTGAASSETVLIPNLLFGWALGAGNDTCSGMKVYHFPLYIPAGTRITAKAQSNRTSQAVYLLMILTGGGKPFGWCGRGVECLGAETASSQGTALTPGGASEGTFVDLDASTVDYHYVFPMLQGGSADTSLPNGWYTLDIGVGGSVYKGLENFLFNGHSSETTAPVDSIGNYTFIPAGTTLQGRLQSDTTNVDPLDCCVYGVY